MVFTLKKAVISAVFKLQFERLLAICEFYALIAGYGWPIVENAKAAIKQSIEIGFSGYVDTQERGQRFEGAQRARALTLSWHPAFYPSEYEPSAQLLEVEA